MIKYLSIKVSPDNLANCINDQSKIGWKLHSFKVYNNDDIIVLFTRSEYHFKDLLKSLTKVTTLKNMLYTIWRTKISGEIK